MRPTVYEMTIEIRTSFRLPLTSFVSIPESTLLIPPSHLQIIHVTVILRTPSTFGTEGVNTNLVEKRKGFFPSASFAIRNRFFQCLFEFRQVPVAGEPTHP